MKILSFIISTCFTLMIFSSVNAQEENRIELEKVVQLQVPGASLASWSSDSTKLAVVTWPDIQIWDANSWELLLTIPDVFVNSIEWDPNGIELAAVRGGREESVLIWDAMTGTLLRKMIRPLPPDALGVIVLHGLSWNPEGNKIASGSGGIDTLLVWSLNGNSRPHPLVPLSLPSDYSHYHNIFEIEWSKDGRKLLSGGTDGTIRVWDAATGESLIVVEGYMHISWHPDCTHFAGSSFDHVINIWDADTGEVELTFTRHTNAINSVEWSPDGTTIASIDIEGNFEIWDSHTGTTLSSKSERSGVSSIVWRPDNRQIAVTENDEVIVWNYIRIN